MRCRAGSVPRDLLWRAAGVVRDHDGLQRGLAELAALAQRQGEPQQRSGKQERYENLLNQYLLR